MPVVLESSGGAKLYFSSLEDAYNHVISCIEKPERWHRMLLHHVRELLGAHTVPHTRLVIRVAFTDDMSEWYEIQVITAEEQRQPAPASQQPELDTRSSPTM